MTYGFIQLVIEERNVKKKKRHVAAGEMSPCPFNMTDVLASFSRRASRGENKNKRVNGPRSGRRAEVFCDLLRLTRGVGVLSRVEKDEQGPVSEAWDVDPGLITKLKEQYKKERKGKKGVKSKSPDRCCSLLLLLFLLLLFLFLSSFSPTSFQKQPASRFN